MTCEARRLLFDYYREKSRKPCPIRLPRFFFKMAGICAISTKPLRRRAFRLDGLITPTYAARRVSEIRKRLNALTPRAAKTKKRYAFDYCLTTKSKKADPRRPAQAEHTCPWRSWIARRTPTPKVAGSNPVGHTTSSQASYRLRRLFMLCVKSHLALTPLLLLSKSNPLRWASIWFSVLKIG